MTSSLSLKSQDAVDCHGEDMFNMTRGRFVMDEEHAMAMRHQRFDADELGKVAAKAVESHSCAKIEKHADGMCNKVFTLTMNDGKVVVAKIPQPHAGPPHYITASEVATMEYVRQPNAFGDDVLLMRYRLEKSFTRLFRTF